MSTMETEEDISLYRKVSATEYYYGYSSNGKKDALLIVYEPDDKTMAREYYKEEEVWTCLGCHNLGEEVCITKIMDKEILTPLKHFCESRTVEEIVKEQKDYKNLLLSGFLEREADFYSSSTEFDKYDPSEYKFGVDSIERQNSRLIVQQKDNPENVYHYHKHGKRWICHGCISITHNIDTFGELIKKDLYLPKQHVCEPIKAEQSEQEQQYLLFNTANLFVDNLFNEQKDALRMLNHYEFKFCTSGLDGFKKKIIVSHPSNRSLIYNFYYKSQSIWHCTKCVQEKKLDTYVIQKDGNMYVSMKHACQPINYFDAGGIQLSVGNSQGRKDKNESMEVQEEAAEILLSDDPSLPSSSDKHSESTKVKKSKKRKASDSDITSIPPPPSQPGTSDGSNNSEILAKIPRMFKQIGGGAKNNVIRVFTPKRSSFPVRIPPSYIHTRNKSGKPVTPSVINYRPPPIVSLSPIYLDDGSESRKNPKSSNINSSPYASNTLNANNNSFDGTIESRNKKNAVEADDDEIQIIEPHIPLIPNLQNQSVSSALLKFIDSKIEDNRNEISLNITASPASSPILPFENDKMK
uniref:Uncharacterized protein n=1 Tax=Panagrolaimus superbus TaxID=310955 RepID=A0A914Y501_9BILA